MGTIYLVRTDRIFNPNAGSAVDSLYFQHKHVMHETYGRLERDGALQIFRRAAGYRPCLEWPRATALGQH
jgi:hypothetical protein